ncbi:MAG: ATP-binding protein [Thermodesulfobacteriota bacterium]|nr:ATP-binding protein [Thermodesulfobacteriota bacterium]
MNPTPFPYETFASDQTFIGRRNEIKILKTHIQNSTNLLVFSKRRMGKSSLIQETFREIDQDYLCLYIDIFEITSAEDFGASLLKSLSNAKKGDIKEVMTWLSRLFKRTRVEPTINPDTLEYSFKPIVRSLSFAEMMDDFFTSLFELAKDKKIVLAIDEFQQIALIKNVKIDALLRKYMQENHAISYIFLGSKRHMLMDLFTYQAPLYEMATPLDIGTLDLSDIYQYATRHLNIKRETVGEIFDLCDGETKLMQHLFHILYRDCGDKEIASNMIRRALNEIIAAKSSSYRIIYDSLSLNQKKAMKILALEGEKIYSKEIMLAFNTKKESIVSALKQLFKKELVDRENGQWFIPDRALEIWCSRL